MSETAAEEPPKSAVLTDISLLNIARAIKENDVQAFLLLDIPLTTVITYYETMRSLNQKETAFRQRAIMLWKMMRETKKEKDRLDELIYALTESDNKALADIVMERNRMNLEITRDLLQSD
ncbi:unnamed protein product [Calicophoron daubneyi]|uniref:Uncharacterized protein n=1 Tax=Calicophoron daubneyi TaxID=300641 RepID=A0AAV2TJX4_CALDB